MNQEELKKQFSDFFLQLLNDMIGFCRRHLFVAASVVVFLFLFINTFFVYDWCHINDDALLSCGSDFGDSFFNYLTSHVLYLTLFLYDKFNDDFSILSLFSLLISTLLSSMFVIGFLVTSFSLFNIPWRIYGFVKETYSKPTNTGEAKSD
ncbi:MAG: hypothetical protein H6858_04315 [Rhodospirillales bacterium]|nr:hypothetical protein [Alphaproteobacteria bacterium]MCB1839995.1 hypothetical protein [Alphaproteobacteria bacterium]MCB9976809.1 hypothetical protein [Rhodospirillales bacterium]